MRGTIQTHPSLLLRLRDAGDHEAWMDFVRVYGPLVYGYCTKRGLQPADAADVTQDVMKSVSTAMPRFRYDRARGTFRAWLLTATRNCVVTHRARACRQVNGTGRTDVHEQIQSACDPRDEQREWDHAHRIHAFRCAASHARAQFAGRTWSAFWQTAVENRPTNVVAEELRMTTGAVYIARCRVTARLRELMDGMSD